MGLSRLCEACRKCVFVNTCNNKRMEAIAYLPEQTMISEASMPNTTNIAAPILRETVERYAYGQKFVMYKDELEKELYGALYKELCLKHLT